MCWRIKIRKVLNLYTFDQTLAQIFINQYFELSFVFDEFKIKCIYEIYVRNVLTSDFVTFLFPWDLFKLLLRSIFSQKLKKTWNLLIQEKLCCVSIKILKLLSILCLQLTESNGTKWFMVKILFLSIAFQVLWYWTWH